MAVSLWDVWTRAETGPICPTREFETKVLFRKTQELVKKYGIKYDPQAVVPTDQGLIDRLWQGGLELLVEVGVLCTNTEKIIQFSKEEILDTIRFFPSSLLLGEGKDAVLLQHRNIEDQSRPVIMGGPLAAPVSEEIGMKAYEAYAREPYLDAFWPGTLGMVGGMPAKAGSAFEMYAEKVNVNWMREAMRRAGRPGLHISGSAATTPQAAIGACNEEWGYRKCDSVHCYPGVNMKADYDTMCRAQHYHSYGTMVWGCPSPFIGGLFGGAEGAALGEVAETLAIVMCFGVQMPCLFVPDAGYAPGVSARKPLWAASLAAAAFAKHTHLPFWNASPYAAYAGPCTDMYLYETAACTIATTVCGTHLWNGAGRGGLATDYFGGALDTRFSAEVGRAATKLTLGEANEMVKAILAKYEHYIVDKNPPLGKMFQECNDMNTLLPTKEYLDLYDKVKNELEALGLRFD